MTRQTDTRTTDANTHADRSRHIQADLQTGRLVGRLAGRQAADT